MRLQSVGTAFMRPALQDVSELLTACAASASVSIASAKRALQLLQQTPQGEWPPGCTGMLCAAAAAAVRHGHAGLLHTATSIRIPGEPAAYVPQTVGLSLSPADVVRAFHLLAPADAPSAWLLLLTLVDTGRTQQPSPSEWADAAAAGIGTARKDAHAAAALAQLLAYGAGQGMPPHWLPTGAQALLECGERTAAFELLNCLDLQATSPPWSTGSSSSADVGRALAALLDAHAQALCDWRPGWVLAAVRAVAQHAENLRGVGQQALQHLLQLLSARREWQVRGGLAAMRGSIREVCGGGGQAVVQGLRALLALHALASSPSR